MKSKGKEKTNHHIPLKKRKTIISKAERKIKAKYKKAKNINKTQMKRGIKRKENRMGVICGGRIKEETGLRGNRWEQ